jgi:hypothetical protein
MKFALLSAVAAVGLALSSGTASAQWRGGHGHGHGHGRGTYTEYHPGYRHGNHYHPGHLHTYSRPPIVYSSPFVVTPYNGVYSSNRFNTVQPGFGFGPYSGFGYNAGYGNRFYGGRRW